MKTSDFYYDLPQELIAQTPIEKRDTSRLMTLDRVSGATGHHHFYDLPDYLNPGDCLIFEQLPGAARPSGGTAAARRRHLRGAAAERQGRQGVECLVRPGRKLRKGTRLSFGNGGADRRDRGAAGGGRPPDPLRLRGHLSGDAGAAGQDALPPTSRRSSRDQERYQTVYLRSWRAAAPTAGSTSPPELLEKIRPRGLKIGYVTLHVGLGTFRPVKEDTIEDHPMHSEYCTIPRRRRTLINENPANGGRCICVGTTSCRTLESWAAEDGHMGGQVRLDGHLYLPRLPIQGDGRPGDQLPPAGEHPHHAGVRCRAGDAGRL